VRKRAILESEDIEGIYDVEFGSGTSTGEKELDEEGLKKRQKGSNVL